MVHPAQTTEGGLLVEPGGRWMPGEAHLQADDVASLLQLLWGKAAVCGLSVLHPHVVLSVEALGLSLEVGELEMDIEVIEIYKARDLRCSKCTAIIECMIP